MRTLIYVSVIGLVIGMIACSQEKQGAPTQTDQVFSKDSLIKRGDYLVSAMGCDDCHSPKRMGPQGPQLIPELRLSGFQQNNPPVAADTAAIRKGWVLMSPDLTAAAGPWGVTFSSNITSDSTGIGSWTEAQFIKAVTEGKSKGIDGNRPLLPPMPWQNFSKLTDADLKAIYTFLQSTKPVHNIVPQPILNHP